MSSTLRAGRRRCRRGRLAAARRVTRAWRDRDPKARRPRSTSTAGRRSMPRIPSAGVALRHRGAAMRRSDRRRPIGSAIRERIGSATASDSRRSGDAKTAGVALDEVRCGRSPGRSDARPTDSGGSPASRGQRRERRRLPARPCRRRCRRSDPALGRGSAVRLPSTARPSVDRSPGPRPDRSRSFDEPACAAPPARGAATSSWIARSPASEASCGSDEAEGREPRPVERDRDPLQRVEVDGRRRLARCGIVDHPTPVRQRRPSRVRVEPRRSRSARISPRTISCSRLASLPPRSTGLDRRRRA